MTAGRLGLEVHLCTCAPAYPLTSGFVGTNPSSCPCIVSTVGCCLSAQACGDLYHEIGKNPSARLVGVTLVQVLTLADGVYLYHLDCVDDTQ